jgi:hypothetical protein
MRGCCLRVDEERRGPSCRIEWHIKVKMHLGRGNFCCSTLNLCCRTTIRMGAGNLKGGILRLGRMRGTKSRVGKA